MELLLLCCCLVVCIQKVTPSKFLQCKFIFDCILEYSIHLFYLDSSIHAATRIAAHYRISLRHLVFFFSISFSRRLSAQFTSAQWDTLSQRFCKILVQLSPSFQKENVFLANLIEVWRNVECNPNLCHNHFSNCSALYRGFEWPCIFQQYLLLTRHCFKYRMIIS